MAWFVVKITKIVKVGIDELSGIEPNLLQLIIYLKKR